MIKSKKILKIIIIVLSLIVIISISILIALKYKENKVEKMKEQVRIEIYYTDGIAPDAEGYSASKEYYYILYNGEIYKDGFSKSNYIKRIDIDEIRCIEKELSDFINNKEISLIVPEYSYIRIGNKENKVSGNVYEEVIEKYIDSDRYKEKKEIEEMAKDIIIKTKDIIEQSEMAEKYAKEYIKSNPNSKYKEYEICEMIIYNVCSMNY